jgi:hypothetical protein
MILVYNRHKLYIYIYIQFHHGYTSNTYIYIHGYIYMVHNIHIYTQFPYRARRATRAAPEDRNHGDYSQARPTKVPFFSWKTWFNWENYLEKHGGITGDMGYQWDYHGDITNKYQEHGDFMHISCVCIMGIQDTQSLDGWMTINHRPCFEQGFFWVRLKMVTLW